MQLKDRTAGFPLKRVVWLLPLAVTVHEFEEWNILAWNQIQFENPPDATPLAKHIMIVLISIIGFVWTGAACLLRSERLSALMALVFFWPIGFSHALQHVYWQLAWEGLGGYAPGSIASATLILPGTLFVTWHARRNRLIGWPLVAALFVTSAIMFAGVVRAGHTLPIAVHSLFAMGSWIAKVLFE